MEKEPQGRDRWLTDEEEAAVLQSCPEENIVFSNDTGQPINIHELRWGFESALKAAGIGDFRWHDLRHSFATRLAQNGVDLFTIQKLLGHKSFAMTQRYAHHCEESLRRGITVLDGYVEGLKTEGST